MRLRGLCGVWLSRGESGELELKLVGGVRLLGSVP